ncbi:MAG: InlB B-repeat-containing protein [Clostridia bacterium]|nr:InlB B-repeat-containing protein [Clostridia bacterium]
MQKTKRIGLPYKALGIICAFMLILSALYVPLSFSASAATVNSVPFVDDVPYVFDFENTETDEGVNKTEAETNGIGYFGWGPTVKKYTDDDGKVTNSVLQLYKNASNQSWGTSGGYRLHTKLSDDSYGFCKLEPSTKYIVSFKLRVISPAVKLPASSDTATSRLFLGYNATYNPNASGSGANYVNGMKDDFKIKVFESVIATDKFTVYDSNGNGTDYPYGEDWIDVRYIINTPEKFEADPVLAFWGAKFHGLNSEIDDVSVIKVGADSGIIYYVDTYSGIEELAVGKAGTVAALPDVSNRAQSAEHKFEGWYSDFERTEKIDELKFTTETQTIYTRWSAPVSITFKDTLNKTEKTITGNAGEAFDYPADPVNPENTSWFVGWYTDEAYTKEHTSGKFGYANQTLYAYFKGLIPGFTQDFENYTNDKYTVKVDDNGQAYKSNRLDFAATMSKQSEVTYDNSGYAIKYHWNPVAIDDKNNEHYYDTSRVTSVDNYFNIGNGLENGTVYVLTFKYLAEKASAPVGFRAISGANGNAWGGMVTYAGPQNFTLETDGAWHEVSFQFTPAYKDPHKQMFLCITNTQNVETIVYFDNIEVEAFAQPYESFATINDGINNTTVAVKGEIGAKIELPTLTHPMGADFLGWYYDEAFTLPAENPVFKRGETKLYASWVARTGFNQGFEEYTHDAKVAAEYVKNNGTADDTSDDYTAVYYSNYLKFYTTLSKQSDVVYEGKYAIKFDWNTDPAFDKDVSKKNGKNILNPDSYEHSRYSAYDNLFDIGTGIKNNEYYTISFKYKVEKGDQKVQFYTISAAGGNSWASRKTYSAPAKVSLTPGDWQEYSYTFKTEMGADTHHLYLGIALTEHKDTIVYFDDVKVISALGPNDVIMAVNNGVDEGIYNIPVEKGAKVNLPTYTHPEGAEFRGWYKDAEFTVPFTDETYPNENFTIYAKWGPYAMSFKDYPYEFDKQKDPNMTVVNSKGVGNGDDYAIKFYVNRKEDNTTGLGSTQAFKIAADIQDGAVYRIRFDYKSTSIQSSDAVIRVTSASSANLWWSDITHSYAHTTTDLKKGGTNGWKTAEYFIKANVKSADGWRVGSDLYLRYVANIYNAGDKIEAYVDNVLVEKIETPYVYFDTQCSAEPYFVTGEAGTKVTLPAKNPIRVGYDFKGWYNEPECETKFNITELAADTFHTAYAKWVKSATVVYSFENYTRKAGDGNWDFEGGVVTEAAAKTGKYGMRYGNRDENLKWSFFSFEDGGEYFKIDRGYTYILTLNYRVNKYTDTGLNLYFLTSDAGNYFIGSNSGKTKLTPTVMITANDAKGTKGKWAKKTFVLDAMKLEDIGAHYCQDLYLNVGGGPGWEIDFDDIAVTKLPKGQVAVAFFTEGVKGCPDYVVGKPGQSFASKIPEKLTKEGMYFKGYFIKAVDGTYTEVTRDKMVFGEKSETIFARFLDYEVTENFDTGFYEKAYGGRVGYTIHDFDYEVYDSEKEGNSKDNVTSGRYSLHRKGTSMYKENSVILTLGKQIAEGERYTVSMKIKLGKHFHTDGAVKIASGRSFEYAWTTTGDYYPVALISELKEGEWVDVSYTFNSVEGFAVIQTPGYCELFIDDIKFKLVDENTPLSEPKEFVEYVANKRDENGNVIDVDRYAIDVSTIIDPNKGNGGSFNWLIVIIAAAAVIVIGAGVTALVVVKKKKKA